MNQVSILAERKLLLSALEHPNPKVRNHILANTSVDDFGHDLAREVRERMDFYLQNGKDLGGARDLAEDAGLTDEAKEFIKGTREQRNAAKKVTRERIEKLVNILHMYRRVRVAYSGLKEASVLLSKKVGEPEIESFCETLERTLVGVKEGFDRQPILHIGKGQSKEELREVIKRITRKRPGEYINCGLDALNLLFKGFKRGNVITLSANSGGGKTAVALNMITNQVKAGYNVCYVGLEMTEEETLFRIAAAESGVPHDIIRLDEKLSKKNVSKITKAMTRLHRTARKNNARLSIWDVKDSFFTPQQMELALRPFGFDVIVIDYITLFSSKHQDTWKMQMEYSRYIKGMAKRMNCVAVVLTQLNEDDEIKYGKSIKENTDYWFKWIYGDEEEQDGECEFKCGKARHAKKKNCTLIMKLDTMKVQTKTDDIVDDGSFSQPTKQSAREQKNPRSSNGGKRRRKNREESTDF